VKLKLKEKSCAATRVVSDTSKYDRGLKTIRYDTIEEFNVDSKAEYTA